MEPIAKKELAGWGRTPITPSAVYRPERRRGIDEILGASDYEQYLARGLGRSYGDTAVNEDGALIDMTRLNRFIGFDEETGVVHCEAGVSLAEIMEAFVPRGFMVPVTPGTKFVTVGGAIANDVHGKNHHAHGAFGEFVESFDLLTPAGELLTCSREENADVFWATLGGIGLTGIILEARVRLTPVESAYFKVDYYRARNIEDILEKMHETQDTYPYSVAWVDTVATGDRLGRSVLMNGNHATADEARYKVSKPLEIPRKREKTIPIDFPRFVLNKFSIGAFNEMLYRSYSTKDGCIVDYDTYFYPLDAIHHWNRMYGKRGFTQYQLLLPFDAKAELIDILRRIADSGRASFLTVLKTFGKANEGLLSFPFEGYTLTLDFAMKDDLPQFLQELDRILVDNGGRLYLAKDVCMSPETFAAMYPRADEFRAVRSRLDPDKRFTSRMAKRLEI